MSRSDNNGNPLSDSKFAFIVLVVAALYGVAILITLVGAGEKINMASLWRKITEGFSSRGSRARVETVEEEISIPIDTFNTLS
ncbi:hypothetical protein AGDE_15567 [Angomonas deanei]|nr:hypothetical protein AGDE_15567 [Angomonas deanei]|eukprot:EPY18843.1 hypothetical protein AGDE_15567 [Angomonas deanei]